MQSRSRFALLAAGAVALAAVSVTPADAACKRLSFLVNDFGKDGPTKDAKDLLDALEAGHQLFEQAFTRKIPVMLTGPTGCGLSAQMRVAACTSPARRAVWRIAAVRPRCTG